MMSKLLTKHDKVTLPEILARIQQADDYEINEILRAIIQRYGDAFPDWEILVISIPKSDSTERRNHVETLIDLLTTHYK